MQFSEIISNPLRDLLDNWAEKEQVLSDEYLGRALHLLYVMSLHRRGYLRRLLDDHRHIDELCDLIILTLEDAFEKKAGHKVEYHQQIWKILVKKNAIMELRGKADQLENNIFSDT